PTTPGEIQVNRSLQETTIHHVITSPAHSTRSFPAASGTPAELRTCVNTNGWPFRIPLLSAPMPNPRSKERTQIRLAWMAALAGASMVKAVAGPSETAVDEWPYYGHDAGGMRYSPLAQINRENVAQLKVAWVFQE